MNRRLLNTQRNGSKLPLGPRPPDGESPAFVIISPKGLDQRDESAAYIGSEAMAYGFIHKPARFSTMNGRLRTPTKPVHDESVTARR
jgi:hypothetical protein